jgi:hypothetical protein
MGRRGLHQSGRFARMWTAGSDDVGHLQGGELCGYLVGFGGRGK